MPTPRPLRGRVAAIVALVLILLAAFVAGLAEDAPAAAPRPAVRIPSYPRAEERKRIAERQTLPALAAKPGASPEEAPPELRDPLLRALPVAPGDAWVVLEANALRHSRLGELAVQCLLSENPDAFAEVARETGIDPLKDVDRVAFAGKAVVVSGFFDRVKWDAFQKDSGSAPARYGNEATLWSEPGDHQALASWRDQLIVVGPAEDVKRAIDQLEGRAQPRTDEVSDQLAFGELYGVVPGAAARKLLPASEGALAARLAAAAERIELHVDAMEDVAGYVRVTSQAGPEVEDLAKALGAALSVARLKATAEGDPKLAALLDHAEVVPGQGGFDLELALPADLLQQFFKDCGKSGGHP
jgi:hypothetical protein